MKTTIRLAVAMVALGLSACVPTYSLVKPGLTPVAKNAFGVRPEAPWNKSPYSEGGLAFEENWTRNGPMLDAVSFVGGLPDGTALLKQNKKADQQVPAFRSDMSPSDLVSMIESYYRIRSRIEIFNVLSVEPTPFLGTTGIKADYDYVGADALPRKGRVVMAIIGSKLYLARLDGAATHYFGSAAREFDAIVTSATLASR